MEGNYSDSNLKVYYRLKKLIKAIILLAPFSLITFIPLAFIGNSEEGGWWVWAVSLVGFVILVSCVLYVIQLISIKKPVIEFTPTLLFVRSSFGQKYFIDYSDIQDFFFYDQIVLTEAGTSLRKLALRLKDEKKYFGPTMRFFARLDKKIYGANFSIDIENLQVTEEELRQALESHGIIRGRKE